MAFQHRHGLNAKIRRVFAVTNKTTSSRLHFAGNSFLTFEKYFFAKFSFREKISHNFRKFEEKIILSTQNDEKIRLRRAKTNKKHRKQIRSIWDQTFLGSKKIRFAKTNKKHCFGPTRSLGWEAFSIRKRSIYGSVVGCHLSSLLKNTKR